MIDFGTQPRSILVQAGAGGLATTDADPGPGSGAERPLAAPGEAIAVPVGPALAESLVAPPMPSGLPKASPRPYGREQAPAVDPSETPLVEAIPGVERTMDGPLQHLDGVPVSASKTDRIPTPPNGGPTLSEGLTGTDPAGRLRTVEAPALPSKADRATSTWARIRSFLVWFQGAGSDAPGAEAAVALLPAVVARTAIPELAVGP